MTKLKGFAIILGIVTAVSLSAQTYKIGYLPTSIGQPATNAWQEGMMRALSKYSNVKLVALDPQLSAQTQVSMMDNLINQKCDAIALQPVDAAALSASVRSAESKGIIVITLNTATIQSHTASVQMPDLTGGYLVGEEMGKQLGGKGNVAIIESPPGATAGVEREKAFRMALAKLYPDIKIVGAQVAEGWKKENAISIMNSFLQADKDLDGIFAVNDNMAEGAMIAAESAGRLSQIKIWGFNGQKSTLALIEQGKMAGTVYSDCYAQGSLVATMIMDRLNKGLGPSHADKTEIIHIKPFAAKQDTVSQIPLQDRF